MCTPYIILDIRHVSYNIFYKYEVYHTIIILMDV